MRFLQSKMVLLLQSSELLVQVVVESVRVAAWSTVTLTTAELGQIFRRVFCRTVFWRV